MLVHQKAEDGNLKLERGLGDHLPMWRTDPEVDMADWHWLTQLNQARAIAYAIEHFRSHFPLNRGTIMWQLNDTWPAVSWAAVDGHGIRKPLWYALRAVNREHFITIQPRTPVSGAPQPTVVLHNDSAIPWVGELVISRRRTIGKATPLAEQSLPIDLAPRSSSSVPIDTTVLAADQPAAEYLTAEVVGAAAGYWYFVEDTEIVLATPAEGLELMVQPDQQGYAVTAAASSLVKDLTLFPDRLDPSARVDSGLVTLQSGQSHTFHVISAARDLDAAAWFRKPVLRCVNDLVGRSAS